jgi:serine incorporator 1/3
LWCAHFFLGPTPFMACYVYTIVFFVTNLLAWTIRDYGRSALSELQSKHVSFYCW